MAADMQIEIHPPTGATSPFSMQWYDLEATKLTFDLSQKIHEYLVSDKNKYVATGYEHSVSTMSITGVLTVDSDLPGTTVEDKKNNWIEACSGWWEIDKGKYRINCMQIKWRGWSQYVMIERLAIEKVAGEEEEYPYELVVKIHEGE